MIIIIVLSIMYNLWYFRTYQTIYPMLVFIIIYIFFSIGVGSIGSRRKIGFFSAFIFSLLFSPLIGSLSDRYGRRPVLLFSMLGFGLDYLFLAFEPSIFWLFVGRTISGITGASITTASAYIADISDDTNRAKNFGMIGAAFGIGAVLSLPIVLFTSAWINSALLVGFVLYIGLATTALGYILFGNGLTHLSPGTVSTLTLAEPVLATLMGVYILGEAMNLRGWIGCAVIIGALALLGIVESRTPTKSNLETSNA